MQTIFATGMATIRFAVGSNEALGVNHYQSDSSLGTLKGCDAKSSPMDKTDQGEGTKATKLLTSDGGRKRKRPCFTKEEVLVMTNLTDAMNNVANTLRETEPAFIDADLYHAIMDTPELSKEALIVAFSHLLGNKAHATAYVNMVESHRVLSLRTFLTKNYYV